VRHAADLPYVFREAFHIASTGRPGPVLIDITKDAQLSSAVPEWNVVLDLPGYQPVYRGSRRRIRQAAGLLSRARRPLIMAGNGVIIAGAAPELRALAERSGIPVVTTLHGLGAFPEGHRLHLGMPGMHGWVHVNRAIQECDVLFTIGARFDDRVTGNVSTFAPGATVIHADVDPAEIGKNVRVAVPIIGDARDVLAALTEQMPAGDNDDDRRGERGEWLAHIRAIQAEHQPRQHPRECARPCSGGTRLMPHDVYAALNRVRNARGGARVVTDVGQHQMWAAQLVDWHSPRTHITSGGAGTMGFAVPAAIGVALAHPDETVWVIAGDGGFQMTNQELATIRQEGIRNIKVAIINNGSLGMVRQWQQLFEQGRSSATQLSGPDFARLTEAYGLRGITVECADGLDAAIAGAWDHDGAVVIDFRIEREVNVFPLVPPGGSISEMMTDALTYSHTGDSPQ
jgi:acetolactate synthase-1/2/3 large subunit